MCTATSLGMRRIYLDCMVIHSIIFKEIFYTCNIESRITAKSNERFRFYERYLNAYFFSEMIRLDPKNITHFKVKLNVKTNYLPECFSNQILPNDV